MVPRYARPAMVAIWEPEARYRIWFEIEAHATEKLGELGVVPPSGARALRASCTNSAVVPSTGSGGPAVAEETAAPQPGRGQRAGLRGRGGVPDRGPALDRIAAAAGSGRVCGALCRRGRWRASATAGGGPGKHEARLPPGSGATREERGASLRRGFCRPRVTGGRQASPARHDDSASPPAVGAASPLDIPTIRATICRIAYLFWECLAHASERPRPPGPPEQYQVFYLL